MSRGASACARAGPSVSQGSGAAWGDEGRRGGYCEGVRAPRGAEVSAEEVEGGPVREEGGARTALLEGEVEEGRVCRGGQTEGVAVCIVDGGLMRVEGGGGDEDARGDVVEGGEAEGVQGAELQYGAGLAVAAGLARPVEGRAGLVDDAEEGELGEDPDADDFRGGGGGGAGVLQDVGCDEGGPAWAEVDEGELLLVRVYDAAGAARALAAVSGHGCHVREGGGDEAAVVTVRELGGGEER